MEHETNYHEKRHNKVHSLAGYLSAKVGLLTSDHPQALLPLARDIVDFIEELDSQNDS